MVYSQWRKADGTFQLKKSNNILLLGIFHFHSDQSCAIQYNRAVESQKGLGRDEIYS
jgi:hypothetical protein